MKNLKNLTFYCALLLLFTSCGTLKNLISFQDDPPIKHGKGKLSEPKNLSNFDLHHIPNDIEIIAKMIELVQPELPVKLRYDYAEDISEAIKIHKDIKPQIMIALIDTESDFNASMISHTLDYSMAQVNVKVWNIEFKRMGIPPIKIEMLLNPDQAYAMKTMAKILSILRKRHEHEDRRWYARYHSNTKKYKWNYLRKIEIRMKLLEKVTKQSLLADKF